MPLTYRENRDLDPRYENIKSSRLTVESTGKYIHRGAKPNTSNAIGNQAHVYRFGTRRKWLNCEEYRARKMRHATAEKHDLSSI